ncbi:RNA polymerase factor sigma-54 [Neotabrizicola sp. VNH66]|uniref:RNA polymerase factor sigma-54 n=1 Tax=Neotabrizicola sp. VNH66 TaxID=3400918 RepID=UPI003C0EB854
MSVSARQTHSQRQTLGVRQLQAIALLRLTNEGLADHLARKAASNPLLRLRLPAPARTEAEEPAASGGLLDHILPQLGLILSTPRDRQLAEVFLEALDPNGWLDRPLPALAAAAGCTLTEAAALLNRLQQGIEPTGLFARDLAECLQLQALERGLLTPALAMVLDRLPLLAEGGPAAVARAAGLPEGEVTAALHVIRRLDPRPGLAFGHAPPPLRAPDVLVTRHEGAWRVELNRATLPALTVDPTRAPELRAARAEAEWLLSVVERRNRTVLAVARAVMERQAGFLEQGPGALTILHRTEIAASLGLHDSTVGRVARDLLVDTPQGLRSLCSLFDGGPTGGQVASAAIRHRMARLIAGENPRSPLSDAALAVALAAEGKPVARRTVTKFREAMAIPVWTLRRRRP